MARLLLIRERLMSVPVRSKAVWYPRRRFLSLVATLALALIVPSFAIAAGRPSKLDGELVRRSQRNTREVTSVIVTFVPGATVPQEFKRFARAKGRLGIINGQVMDLPNNVLRQLEARPEVFRIHYDRPIAADNYRTSIASGARAVQQGLGFTGAGIGVAVIDSGITTWHDDLASRTPMSRTATSASPRLSISSTAARCRTTTRATARTSRGSSPATAAIRAARNAGVAPDATLVCAESARRRGPRHDQQRRSRRSTGCWRHRRAATTSASSTSRSARRCASRTGPTR